MGDADADEWLALFNSPKAEEDIKPELAIKKRRVCSSIDEIVLPQVAPLYTEDGQLTFWGVIKQNHNTERRRLKRRQEIEKKRQAAIDKAELEQKRRAVLEETEGNEFLADIFCDIPSSSKVVSTAASDGRSEDITNSFDLTEQYSIEELSGRPEQTSDMSKEEEMLEIFSASRADETAIDPVGLFSGGDELANILGGEVEVLEGDRVGRLNPFPGAYRKGKRRVWTVEEEKVLHEGLARYGTDFMLIKDMLVKSAGAKDLSEKDIVLKYKKELRRKALLI